ncbi:FAD-dependent monooxygenase [Nocardia sp. NPDC052112]|uniref:FAD-dependent monooxygenase n=1 Tax=Nocardia sp. NPDC052112 TaxID=3155646 RepID=UPI003414E193
MRTKTVLISGASIAGPALAYWLNRYGFDVTVVERASSLRPGGQAVDFTGETHHKVLEHMGILDDIYAHRTGTTDIAIVDGAGAQQAVISGDFTGGDVEILRGDLARIMYEKTYRDCEYVFGDSISALTETDDGVWVEFEKGTPRGFDLVFGADGIHSRVRRLAFGPEKEFVKHLGHYYCVAGASPWATKSEGTPERMTAYGYNEPGKCVITGGSKAQQLYIFASPELDYARDDAEAQRRIVRETFADVGWEAPRMLAEMDDFDDFFLDSISMVRKMKSFSRGRIALVGDSGYGNTLGGFGTGLAVQGAYIIAGELALADGDYPAAFARYDERMQALTKLADYSNAGRFFAPKTALGIKFRNWFLHSWMFDKMVNMTENVKTIELPDYPALVTAADAN